MNLQIDLSNRLAVVTGVSRGIGAGVAEVLAKTGCDVAGCGIEPVDSESAKRFVTAVESQGRRPFYQSIDLVNGTAARGATRFMNRYYHLLSVYRVISLPG